MNRHHRKILHSLFAHPISSNIAMKDVEHVLTEMGAEVSRAPSGRIRVALNGHRADFSDAGHGLSREEVVQLRKFIVSCGIDPQADYPV